MNTFRKRQLIRVIIHWLALLVMWFAALLIALSSYRMDAQSTGQGGDFSAWYWRQETLAIPIAVFDLIAIWACFAWGSLDKEAR